MVHLPEERVALWPWRDGCGKNDLHFWVEEPGTQEFLHTALIAAACSAVAVSACAVAAAQTQQAEAEDHEQSAQSSAVPAAQIPDKQATQLRWADIEDSESEDTPRSSERKLRPDGPIQEAECSEAHGAARNRLGKGEVKAFLGSISEPAVNSKTFRPRWGDIDDSESDDQTVADSHFAQHKLVENEGLRIQGECDDGEKAQAADVAEVAGQRKKGSATRGKRGGVKRNAGRQAARSAASWDAASQRPNKSWDASSSWQKGGWASSSSQQTGVWTSWQQTGSEVDSTNWGQRADWVPRPRKWQCQFIIGIDEEPTFRVVRRLLGPGGKNVKAIAEETGAKLRLRGVGSKFLEGPQKLESTDPLMLCVSAPTDSGYDTAVHMVQEILQHIYIEYQEFQSNNGVCTSPLSIQMHVGAREYF